MERAGKLVVILHAQQAQLYLIDLSFLIHNFFKTIIIFRQRWHKLLTNHQ